MAKQLEIGTDYAGLFGLPKGASMIYLGNDTWQARKPSGETMTAVSAKQTAAALKSVQASFSCGGLR